MTIYLIHSTHSEASRNLVNIIGGDGMAQDQDIIYDGHPIKILSRRQSVLDASIPLYPVPSLVVVDGGEARGGSVETWADCLDFIDNPPVPAPSVPAPKVEFTKTDFLDLFTVEEQIALKGLEKTDDAVALFWERYRVADNIRLDDPRTIGAINMLAAAGHITLDRAAAILEG